MDFVNRIIRELVRPIIQAPASTIAAILCLGLALGSATAIFSAVEAALLRPSPLRDPDRLVDIFVTSPRSNTGPFSPGSFLRLQREARSLEGVAAMRPAWGLLAGEEPVRIDLGRVSDNFFSVLGVQAQWGRLIRPGDGADGQPNVVVVSSALFQSRLAGDSSRIGQPLRIGLTTYTLVGVLPPDFRLLQTSQELTSDAWVPLRFSPAEAAGGQSDLFVFGRLTRGVEMSAANAELGVLGRRWNAEAQVADSRYAMRLVGLTEEAVRGVRGVLWLLFGAASFVLLIAAANVASILLARGVSRRRMVAVRLALGASRRDIVRGALGESLALGGLSVCLGLALAWLGVRLVGTAAAAEVPQMAGLRINVAVIVVGVVLAAVVSILCGVGPAWQAARTEPQELLRGGASSTGRLHNRFLGGLVIGQVALSLILLIGSGLLLRSFHRLLTDDPGFDPRPVLSLDVTVPFANYADRGTVAGFLNPALAAIRQVPGVEHAAAISLLPFRLWGNTMAVRYEGRGEREMSGPIELRVASEDFFRTIGLPLMRGRTFNAADAAPDAPRVAVVNAALARRDYPGTEAIGQRFHLNDSTFATIVGVVADLKNTGPLNPPQPELYWPYEGAFGRYAGSSFALVVRAPGDPRAVARAVVTAIRSVEPGAAVMNVRPMAEVIAGSVGRQRLYATLLAALGALATLLALAGLYGITSYGVAQRTRELGIRTALGSSPARTVRLVFAQAASRILPGLAIGLGGSVVLTELLRAQLFGLSPLDGPTWAAAAAVLAVVGVLAVLVPAFRATRVDPMLAIRVDR